MLKRRCDPGTRIVNIDVTDHDSFFMFWRGGRAGFVVEFLPRILKVINTKLALSLHILYDDTVGGTLLL